MRLWPFQKSFCLAPALDPLDTPPTSVPALMGLLISMTSHSNPMLAVQSSLRCVQLHKLFTGIPGTAAAICVTVLQDLQEESGSLADVLNAGLKKAPEDDQLAFGGPRYQATDPSSQVGGALSGSQSALPAVRPPMPAVR